MEKCLRAEAGNPRREWGMKVVRNRLKKKGWRERAKEVLGEVASEVTARSKIVRGLRPWRSPEVEWRI